MARAAVLATFKVTVNNPAAVGFTNIVNNTSDTDTLDANSDLALTKTPDITQAIPGQTITYTLNYSNIGNQGATGVVITETVPTDTTFDSAASSPTVWSCPDNSVGGTSCTTTIGSVAGGGANGTAKFAVKVIATPVGTSITNTATIDDDNANPVDPPGNDSTGSVVTSLCSNPVVTNTNNTGAGSLRQAIVDVCDGGTVTFNIPIATDLGCNSGAGPCTITLATELTISKSLTIDGPTAESVIVSGGNASRVFEITAGTVNINDLTISNGQVSAGSNGAGINNAGTLNLTGVTVSGNLAIPDATGTTGGGGIFNSGTLTLTNSTISGNHADTGAGAGNGGGIFNSATGTLTLTNCTVSGNVTDDGGQGGGINNANAGANTANLQDTIVANNTVGAGGAGPDLKGAFNSLDYNLFETTTDATFTGTTTHNITGQDPVLGPLQDNGGPTFTHALLAGSPAIDAGNSALITDQRGNQRPVDDGSITNVGNGSDIGAFEVPDPTAPTADIVDVTPDPRNTSVSSITIVFSEVVSGFDLNDLSLTLNGGSNLLPGPGPATLTSSDQITFTLNNLSAITNTPGTYVLTLTASTSGITDASLNPLAGDATDTWLMETTAPMVTSIDDGDADDIVLTGTTLNYTVTFNEDIDSSTVSAADFDNAGTSAITIGTITETTPTSGIFNVQVTPTSAGTLQLRIPSGAIINDVAGNALVTPVMDDTTLTVLQDTFTTFEVNTLADDPDDGACTPLGGGGADCTLREAINLANADAGAETITFAAGLTGTITLNTLGALPGLDSDMTITGPGANVLTVARDNAAARFRIFTTANSAITVNISGLTISNGLTADGAAGISGGDGGGILNDTGATLNLKNLALVGNFTGNGGTGAHGGNGGGVYNSGTLTLTNSTLSGNTTGNGSSAFDPAGNGGGIYNAGTLTLTNSTLSGNQTGDGIVANGGGIFNTGTLTLNDCTVSKNTTVNTGNGAGIVNNSGTTNLKNTIVADNTKPGNTPSDLSGTFNSQDYNLIGNDSGATFTGTTTHNILNVSANLGALGNNGGPTQTMHPLPGSPAINAGDDGTSLPPDTLDADNDSDTTEALPVDQRGFTRVVHNKFDIGAVEVQAGTADHLVFNVQPSNTIAGASITPAVTVQILDAGNNLTTSTANVTVGIGNNPGVSTLSGTTTVAAVNGTATFSNLSLNNIGVGYTLTAGSTGLVGATSNTFNVTSPATVSGTKTVTGIFKVGNTVTYTVVLSNTGPATQLDNPTNEFTDTLPVGLTLVSASGTSGTTSTGGNTVMWNGAIASGNSVTITIQATINNGQAGNTIANQGTINYDSNGDGANDTPALTGNAVGNNNPTSFVVNNLPTISAVGVTRTAGSPGSNSTIANVNDVEDAEKHSGRHGQQRFKRDRQRRYRL